MCVLASRMDISIFDFVGFGTLFLHSNFKQTHHLPCLMHPISLKVLGCMWWYENKLFFLLLFFFLNKLVYHLINYILGIDCVKCR